MGRRSQGCKHPLFALKSGENDLNNKNISLEKNQWVMLITFLPTGKIYKSHLWCQAAMKVCLPRSNCIRTGGAHLSIMPPGGGAETGSGQGG